MAWDVHATCTACEFETVFVSDSKCRKGQTVYPVDFGSTAECTDDHNCVAHKVTKCSKLAGTPAWEDED